MNAFTHRPDYRSDANPTFRSKLAEDIFQSKYAHEGCETWENLCYQLIQDVCGDGQSALLAKDIRVELREAMIATKFIPGGRYLYYAGRPTRYYNNCFLLKAEEDTREDWANLSWKSESCLMIGGGIGVDYSIYRERGRKLSRTGGIASGPIPKMKMINEIGRHVMQGGSRRSAIYASLDATHGDAMDFLTVKDWRSMPIGKGGMTLADVKEQDFDFPAPLDMTNISLNYKTAWLEHFRKTGDVGEIFEKNVRQALSTGEPGFSFNFFGKENETLRNACTEVTSEDDSDVCNLGSINMGVIETIEEFAAIVELATLFLICGTMQAALPYTKVHDVRQKNRRLGLGLMGIHEWLLKRGYHYSVPMELHHWLAVWKEVSDKVADEFCDVMSLSRCRGKRAVAPTGSIAILGSTTSGIEPVYAVAYKRRYLKNMAWHWQYKIDAISQQLIHGYGVAPDDVESASDLARDPERRISFQADIQDYCDHAISSTINLPAWGSEHNSEDHVSSFASLLAKYAHRLRGFTCYPDGSRGGQPLTPVSYEEAVAGDGLEFTEEVNDICDISGHGGSCGV